MLFTVIIHIGTHEYKTIKYDEVMPCKFSSYKHANSAAAEIDKFILLLIEI